LPARVSPPKSLPLFDKRQSEEANINRSTASTNTRIAKLCDLYQTVTDVIRADLTDFGSAAVQDGRGAIR
jgi:hypothetical protein